MIKKMLIIVTVLTLTACGGGGDKETNNLEQPIPQNTAPKISSSYTSIYMDENTTLSIPLKVENKESENLKFEIETTSTINASVNAGNNLIINTNEISNDINTFITVIVTDESNLRDDVKFNLNIKNIVKEPDQITLEITPRSLKLLSPKNDIPSKLAKQITYNIISKDNNNEVTVSYSVENSSITGSTNPYFTITKNINNAGFTFEVNQHDNYEEDIVKKGYDKTNVIIKAGNGKNSDSKIVVVSIEPLDQPKIEERLQNLITLIDSLSSFNTNEEIALLKYMVEHLENIETINLKQKQVLLEEIIKLENISLNSSSSELTLYKLGGFNNGIARLGFEAILNLSQEGQLTLEELLSLLSSINLEEIEKRLLIIKQERYAENAKYFEDYIDSLDSRFDLGFPELDLSDKFESEQGLSTFIGNGNFGYLNDLEWKAFKRYTFLEGVLAKLYNTTEFKINNGATSESGE